MSKKIEILFIIILLVSIPVGFSFLSKSSTMTTPRVIQTEKSRAQKEASSETLLAFTPSTYIISSTSGSLNIDIATGSNKVTAAQLEISYDPTVISDIKITPGTFFENPIELLKKIDQQTGKISYAFGAGLTANAKNGKGKLATITFTTTLKKGQTTNINFLPQTIITAEGEQQSVLKKAENVVISR